MMPSQRKGFHYGALVLLLSAVLVKLIGALFKIPISSDYCLSDKGFGYFSYAYDCFTPLYTIAMSGFPVALARVIADQGKADGGATAFFSARRLYRTAGILFSVLVILICVPRFFLNGKNIDMILPFAAIAPAAFFCPAMSSYRGYYEGLGDMIPTAVSELAEALGKLILGFSFAFVTVRYTGNLAYGAAAAMLGISLGAALAYFYLKFRFFKNEKSGLLSLTKENRKSDPALTKSLIAVVFPVTLAALSVNMAPLIDALTAEGALGPALYGIRAKAYTLYNLVPAFSVLLAVSAVPAVAYVTGSERKSNIRSVLKFSALLSFPMAAGLFAASDRIMSLLYGTGESVSIGGKLLKILAITAAFSGLAIPMTGILQAIGKQGIALRNIAIGIILKLLLNLVLVPVPGVGVFGTGYATLICYAAIFILHFLSIRGNIREIALGDFPWLKPLTSSFLCGLTAHFVLRISSNKIVTLSAITAAVFVYFCSLILLHCFTIEDIPQNLRDHKLIKFCVKYRILR